VAEFLFKCETCSRTETLAAKYRQKRFCAECYRIRHSGCTHKRRTELRQQVLDRKAKEPCQPLACEVCSGVPDRRPMVGLCRCGLPYLVECRDGYWRPPRAEKAG
jgi:hypothetical protein